MPPRRNPLDADIIAPRQGATHRFHLTASGVSVVLDVTDGRSPAIVHWGTSLGEPGALGADGLDALCTAAVDAVPPNAVDVPVRVGIIPQQADGWIGRPGLTGTRPDGSGWAPRLITESITLNALPVTAAHVETGAGHLRFDLADDELGLSVALEVELLETGLLRTRAAVTNTAEAPYGLEEL